MRSMAALQARIQKPSQTRGAQGGVIVPLERHRGPQRASDLCLRGRDLPAPRARAFTGFSLPPIKPSRGSRKSAPGKPVPPCTLPDAENGETHACCPPFAGSFAAPRLLLRRRAAVLFARQTRLPACPAPATARRATSDAAPATTATTRTSTRSGAPGRRSLDRGATTARRAPLSTTSS